MMARLRPPSGSTSWKCHRRGRFPWRGRKACSMAGPNRDGEHLDRRLIGVAVMRIVIVGVSSRLHAARYAPALLLEFATLIAYRRLCRGKQHGPADSNTYRR